MMKKTILVGLLLASGIASAQYTGNMSRQNGQGVTIVTAQRGTVTAVGNPVFKQVPSRQCSYDNQNNFPQSNSNGGSTNVAGAVLGAVIGGVVGSQFGGGTGRDVAIAGGAALGSHIGGGGQSNQGSNGRQNCQTVYEQQLVGYWVIIRYGNVQLEDVIRRQVNVGDTVEVKVRSTVYLEQ